MRKGNVSFPGLHSFISASITITDGIAPSVCIIQCAADGQLPDYKGTLVLEYDGTSIVMPDSAVNRAVQSVSSQGNIITFQILDRRWRWQFGEPIDGLYNQRNPDGSIVKGTERTPQTLARALSWNLDQTIGVHGVNPYPEVTKYNILNVDDLPNDTRPFVDWIDVNPATALGQLVESLGSVIVPQLNGSFAIRKRGVGPDIGSHGGTRSVGITFTSPVRPNIIHVSGEMIKYQSKFKLEAVGLDVGNEIKLLSDLSYRPTNGFQDPFEMSDVIAGLEDNQTPEAELNDTMKLALDTVYRWYRVKELAEESDGGFGIAGVPILIGPDWWGGGDEHGEVRTLKNILPLIPTLVETEKNEDGVTAPKRAFVTGRYSSTGFMVNTDDNATADTPISLSFSIMADTGIVSFGEPVTMFDVFSTESLKPAELRLTCSCNIIETNGYRHKTVFKGDKFDREGATKVEHGTLWDVIKVPELMKTMTSVYDGDNRTEVVTNETTIEEEANKYIEERKLQFQSKVGGTVELVGLVPFELDGATRQVTYSISKSGTFTTVSRNGEHNTRVMTDRQKRRQAKLDKIEERVQERDAKRERRKSAKTYHL